ncbi:MAG TPA: hypothetical protein VEV41_08015 [Terriglobales bacterium]|nr:hypothetical protein [Terriglobales bacterium]
MGRLGSIRLAILFLSLFVTGLVGCGGSSTPAGPPLAASIKLTPATASIELGSTLQLTASALGSNQQAIAIAFAYQSSNPQVLTVANNGLACAGSWDSLVAPAVCTPTGVGIAQVTASASGTTSAPVTVYVHQHIDQVTNMAVSPLPGALLPGPSGCLTVDTASVTTAQSRIYQAKALSQGMDITSTVGPITWTAVNSQVATTSTTAAGLLPGQMQATAKTPGLTQIFASVGNNNSNPLDFSACAVQSISLTVGTSNTTIISGSKGSSSTINATVVDIANNLLGNIPLTWSSTQPAVATAPANTAASVTVSGANVGGTSITASCIPPGCNSGFSPLQAIYPPTPITVTYTAGTGTTATSFPAFATTTNPQCDPANNCTPVLVQISGSPPTATAAATLPSIPNSLRSTLTGDRIYLGSDKGLMQVNPTANPVTVTNFATVTGKVLAISPSGGKVIVADTAPVTASHAAKQIFVFDTTTNSSFSFLLDPNVASAVASFSPDNLKAFIAVTIQPTGGAASGILYVYSTQAALQTIPLSAPASDVAFLPDGAFGYLAEPSGLSYLATCDVPSSIPTPTNPPVAGGSTAIHPLSNLVDPSSGSPDEMGFITLVPPNVEIVTSVVTGSGCIPAIPPGTLAVSNTAAGTFNLGQGTFTPVDFLVSTDGQKAYVLIQNQASVVAFDIPGKTISSMALVGTPAPLAGNLTPDGLTLYVAANDNNVHVIDTVVGGDVQQVVIPPSTLCSVASGAPPSGCSPDLLLVRP